MTRPWLAFLLDACVIKELYCSNPLGMYLSIAVTIFVRDMERIGNVLRVYRPVPLLAYSN